MTNTQITIIEELYGAYNEVPPALPIPARAAIGASLEYLRMFAQDSYLSQGDPKGTLQWADDVVSGRVAEGTATSSASKKFLNNLLIEFFTSLQEKDFNGAADTGAIISAIKVFATGAEFDLSVEASKGPNDEGLEDILWAVNYVGKSEVIAPIIELFNLRKQQVARQ